MAEPIANANEARARIVEMLRRDLIGPLPADVCLADADLQRERLREQPSWWYLTGYLAPIEDLRDERLVSDLEMQEEAETEIGDLIEDEVEEVAGSSAADDNQPPEMPATRRRFAPSSIGLTVLVPATARTVTVSVTWGDYVTEPPLSATQLTEEGATGPEVEWLRQPREATVELAVPEAGKGRPVVVPDSAAPELPGGALELVAHARPFTLEPPGEAAREVRALSVFLVNRRKAARRRYADAAYAFQVRLEIRCEAGLVPRHDLSAWRSNDEDQRIADLHYRDEVEQDVRLDVAHRAGSDKGTMLGSQVVKNRVERYVEELITRYAPVAVGYPRHLFDGRLPVFEQALDRHAKGYRSAGRRICRRPTDDGVDHVVSIAWDCAQLPDRALRCQLGPQMPRHRDHDRRERAVERPRRPGRDARRLDRAVERAMEQPERLVVGAVPRLVQIEHRGELGE